jgi:hypothetical protein
MKKKSVVRTLALVGLLALFAPNGIAGSAVATDDKGDLETVYGGTAQMARQRALEKARHRYGAEFRILASTNQTGYGAIAVAVLPNRRSSVIGVALGKRSATEADTMAKEHCLKAGGVDPVVRWGFRG